MCDISDFAVSSVYPLIFKNTGQMGPNRKYFSKGHMTTLNQYLKSKSHIILSKYLRILHPEGYTTCIGPKYTKPSKRSLKRFKMKINETKSSYIITKIKSKKSKLPSNDTSEHELELVVDEPTQELLTPSELQFQNENVYGHNSEPVVNIIHTSSEVLDHVDSALSKAPLSENQSVGTIRPYSEYDSTKTLPFIARKYRNMMLCPEKMTDSDFISLIHINKSQFLEFSTKIGDNLNFREEILSLYSRAFLFRLRSSSCWTQEEVSSLFCILESTGRQIFWDVLTTYYENEVNIPNLLLEYDVIETVLDRAYYAMDPFFKELVSAFEDPAGKKKLVF